MFFIFIFILIFYYFLFYFFLGMYFLKNFSAERMVLNNTINTLTKYTMMKNESNFSVMNFFSLFSALELDVERHYKIIEETSLIICCFKDYSQIVLLAKKISENLNSLKKFQISVSAKDISSFNLAFLSFSKLCTLWKNCFNYIDFVQSKISVSVTPGIFDRWENNLLTITGPLNEKECEFDQISLENKEQGIFLFLFYFLFLFFIFIFYLFLFFIL